VFFVRPIGFCQPTAVRRISYSDSLRFERVHESEYRRLGFEIVDVPAGAVGERAAMIDACIRSWAERSGTSGRTAAGHMRAAPAGSSVVIDGTRPGAS
jgi:hypothetical protein